ncbi:MAG: undecaprenyl-phosphate alpha N-acetylglucosaminyltransferase [Pseudomonadota bacterium]|jgi:putative polymerase
MAITFDSQLSSGVQQGEGSPVVGFLRFLTIASVLGGLVFNLFLCFVNTRIMPVSDTHVILMEMAVTGSALLAALDRRAGFYLFLAIFISFMLLLFMLRGATDIKAIRDILVPVVFYTLGTRVRDLALADRLVVIAAAIALPVALFEYFLLDLYLDFFNVLGYYIARGTVSLQESYGATRGLFISGNRPEPRTILPFLGQHRVSSVFLEPVSMGNFGVILYSWALFRQNWKPRWFLFAAALTMITLADARFGLFTCILITVARPFLPLVPRTFWLITPFLFLAVITIFGLVTGTNGGPNDIGGRFQATAHILTNLSAGVVFGYETTDQFTADSGFAYTLTKFSLLGFIGLWAMYVFLPFRSEKGRQFHGMMTIYLLLIMVISNSFYSIKTGSLMWFILGTVSAIQFPETKSFIRRMVEKRRSA